MATLISTAEQTSALTNEKTAWPENKRVDMIFILATNRRTIRQPLPTVLQGSCQIVIVLITLDI